jgi:tripartite-type tricarboxylate transporter receptor subunit TctC
MAGIQGVHVPYKGGAPAATDVMAGRIAYYFAGMPVGLPLSKSGKVRALGTTGKDAFFRSRGPSDNCRARLA